MLHVQHDTILMQRKRTLNCQELNPTHVKEREKERQRLKI